MFRRLKKDVRGAGMLALILVFGAVATTIIISGVATYGLFENRASIRQYRNDLALHIAEAGINYYRWHLAHDPDDYQDGTGQPGPYVHNFFDKDNNLIGTFTLGIQPPASGSSVVIVSSTGRTVWDSSIERTIQVRLGFPGLSDYTFLNNSNMSFSETSSVNGQIHANGGIRFDGTTDSWVRSAQTTYEYQPGNWQDGVWGSGGPQAFWEFPVPAIDFDSVSADLASIQSDAISGGVHLTSSGDEGWHLQFSSTTVDVYRVTSRDCYYGQGFWWWWFGWYWNGDIHCNDIGSETFVQTYSLPANGMMFVEDDVWVDGTVDGRITVGVGEFPVQQPYHEVYISGNVNYAERSSDDVIGLISQGDIIIPYEVPDILTIDAAMLSQYGAIHRPYYYNDVKTDLTIFGSQVDYLSGGMKWVSGSTVVSGFVDTNYLYDGNLKYYPPPGFPVDDTYDLISWEEIE